MVYIITDNTYCKIGYSKDPKKRLSTLQVANPKILYFKYIFKGLSHSEEKKLHDSFKRYKTEANNEWFNFNTVNLDELLKRKQLDINQGKLLARQYNKQVISTKKHFKKKVLTDKDKIKYLLADIRKSLKNKKKRISYAKYIKKYNFTKEEISYYVKSANLSGKIMEHNKHA